MALIFRPWSLCLGPCSWLLVLCALVFCPWSFVVVAVVVRVVVRVVVVVVLVCGVVDAGVAQGPGIDLQGL